MHQHSLVTVRSTMYTTGAYVVQSASKACSADTILGSISECKSAKTVLEVDAADVESVKYDNTPKGCSRNKGKWYFNTHATGALDGASEPICKAVVGNFTGCMPILLYTMLVIRL